MLYKEMTEAQRADEYKLLCEKLDEYKRMNLKLDMSRGKPSAEQLELSQGMLGVINSPEDCFTLFPLSIS